MSHLQSQKPQTKVPAFRQEDAIDAPEMPATRWSLLKGMGFKML